MLTYSASGCAVPWIARYVRLTGGPTSSEGRVEVLRHGVWAGLCAGTFDGAAATVICRQLGFRCVAGDQVCSIQNVVIHHRGAGNKMLGAAEC